MLGVVVGGLCHSNSGVLHGLTDWLLESSLHFTQKGARPPAREDVKLLMDKHAQLSPKPQVVLGVHLIAHNDHWDLPHRRQLGLKWGWDRVILGL